MPWLKLEEVPQTIRTHKGANLTIEQANKWGEIFDSLKENSAIKDAAAAAWLTWEEIYELKEGAWDKRVREAAESMLWIDHEMAEGAFNVLEYDKDGLPSKVKVLVIQEGQAVTKNRTYPRQPLSALAKSGKLDNLKMYDQHAEGSESIPGAIYKPRSVRDYLSYIVPGTSEFVESIKTKSGTVVSGITAIVKLIDRDFKYKVAEAAETLGLSLSGVIDAFKTPAGETVVESIRKVVSLDWLTGEPNCGGCVLEFVEAAEPGSITQGKEVTDKMDWSAITIEELKKNRPDLVAALLVDAENAAKDAATKAADAEGQVAAAETKVTEANAQTNAAVAEAAKAKQDLSDKVAEFAEAQKKNEAAALTLKVIETAESKCAGLNILGKSQVLKSVLGKTFKTEEEIAEAIDSEVAKQPQTDTKPAAQEAAKDMGDSSLPSGSVEVAESIGLSAEEIKRLNEVR